MTNSNLPVKSGEDFVGELEVMDLSELKGKQYMVAISSGDPNGPKFVCSSIRGPFSFEEMCEAVGIMWREHQHHAKVMVCQKDMTKAPTYLDGNTVDYIEAKFDDIITESMLEGVFDDIKDYTCRAGLSEVVDPENPLLETNKVEKSEDTDEEEM
jgi:hypothetical protein